MKKYLISILIIFFNCLCLNSRQITFPLKTAALRFASYVRNHDIKSRIECFYKSLMEIAIYHKNETGIKKAKLAQKILTGNISIAELKDLYITSPQTIKTIYYIDNELRTSNNPYAIKQLTNQLWQINE